MKNLKIKFLTDLQVMKNASEHTTRNYALDLDQFESYLDAVPLEKVDKKVVRGYLAKLHEKKGLSVRFFEGFLPYAHFLNIYLNMDISLSIH